MMREYSLYSIGGDKTESSSWLLDSGRIQEQIGSGDTIRICIWERIQSKEVSN